MRTHDMINKLQVLGFDWDDGNRKKCQKHGLSIKIIEAFFKQKKVLVAPDIKHSHKERRYLAIGRASNKKPMIVVFTLRDFRIRPISARYMHKKEAEKYEKIYSKF